jgi:hypothetical protein
VICTSYHLERQSTAQQNQPRNNRSDSHQHGQTEKELHIEVVDNHAQTNQLGGFYPPSSMGLIYINIIFS